MYGSGQSSTIFIHLNLQCCSFERMKISLDNNIMKHLRWVTNCWLMLVVAICVARLYGQSKPDNLSAFGLDLCEGRPCFMGITPGITKWDDVPVHLKEYQIVSEAESIRLHISDDIE